MSIPSQPCECSPYSNICCCGPKSGVSVIQPACQTLPDGSIVQNPSFVPSLNKSFWSYKFITDCDSATKAISNFGIIICEVISHDNIIVSEKIDGCGNFVPVPFTLAKNDPNFGAAPEGFQFLKVETSERYGKGVCVEYRLEIIGDFPVDSQPIKVKAGNNVLSFDCEGCFLVPKCNPQGKLTVTKKCSHTIKNNQASLSYHIEVGNIGNASLENVQFEDIIFIPTQLALGLITVTPSTLTVDTRTPGTVRIFGNLGTITPGGNVSITYNIKIANVQVPGKYLINNTANAAALGTQASASCSTNIRVVKLKADKCCSIEGNKTTYTLTISSVDQSPDILVNLYDRMEVPSGVTVKFLDLSGCEGYYSGTLNPVPTNTDITGPASFDFICKNAPVPAGGAYIKYGSYLLVSSSVVGTSTITNTIFKVEPVNPDEQILLDVLNIPASANVNVQLTQVCQKPC